MAAHLRVYSFPDETSDEERPQPTVHMRLGDLLPLVALAQKNHYVWLQDFLDDEVAITDDLYELLIAFRSYRPSA
jgi:hypothetical protein